MRLNVVLSKIRGLGSSRSRRNVGVMVAVLGLLVAGLVVPRPGEARACSAKGAVVVVAGTNDTESAAMQKTINQARDAGMDVIDVKYPTTLWPIGSVGFDKDVDMGVKAARKAISDYRAQCGLSGDEGDRTGHIEVIGYSQGARIAGDVLSDIGNNRLEGVDPEGIKGTLYSDPRQEAIDGFYGRGIELSFLGVIPGLQMSGSRQGGFGVLAGDVRTLCSQGDGICYLADPLKDPLGAIDSLVGYILKHGDYPLKGWMGLAWNDDPDNPWNPGNENWDGELVCKKARNNGGTVCVVERVSSVTLALRQIASGLGLDGDAIPDIYKKVQQALNINGVLPGATLSDLQPIVDIVFGALPKVPYITYNVGGYLPDLMAALDVVGGLIPAVLSGDTTQFKRGAKAIAGSFASILAVPVNATIYWGNKLNAALGGSPTLLNNGKLLSIGFIPAESGAWTPVCYPSGGAPTHDCTFPNVARTQFNDLLSSTIGAPLAVVSKPKTGNISRASKSMELEGPVSRSTTPGTPGVPTPRADLAPSVVAPKVKPQSPKSLSPEGSAPSPQTRSNAPDVAPTPPKLTPVPVPVPVPSPTYDPPSYSPPALQPAPQSQTGGAPSGGEQELSLTP